MRAGRRMHEVLWSKERGSTALLLGFDVDRKVLLYNDGETETDLAQVAFAGEPAKAAAACSTFLSGAKGFDELTLVFRVIPRSFGRLIGMVEVARVGRKLMFIARTNEWRYWYAVAPTVLAGAELASEADAAQLFRTLASTAEKDPFYKKGHGAYVHEFALGGEQRAHGACMDDAFFTFQGALPADWTRTSLNDPVAARAAFASWLFQQLASEHILESITCDFRLKREMEMTVKEWLEQLPLSEWSRVPRVFEAMGLPQGKLDISIEPPASEQAIGASLRALTVPATTYLAHEWHQAAAVSWTISHEGRETGLRLLPPAEVIARREELQAQLISALPRGVAVDVARAVVLGLDSEGRPRYFGEIDPEDESCPCIPYLLSGRRVKNMSVAGALIEDLRSSAGPLLSRRLGRVVARPETPNHVGHSDHSVYTGASTPGEYEMATTKTFSPGHLETPDCVVDLAFDASERFLVADDMVFAAGNPEPTSLGVESGTLVPHPSKPLVAVLRDGGVDLVELDGKRRVVHLPVKDPNCGAFDSTGKWFVVSCYYSHELRIFSLAGELSRTVAMPSADDTAPAVVFGPDDLSVVAFTDNQKMVTVPLDGSPAVEHSLAKVKVLGGYALRVGTDRVLFHDSAHAAMVAYDGKVLWTSRAEKEAVSRVPGAAAIAFVRLNKKLISFLSPTDGKELASVKIKIKSAPLGFACSRNLAAWARDGAVELVALPALPPTR